MESFDRSEAWALERDAADPLRAFRDAFHVPLAADGRPSIYFCGNSLGLMPRAAADVVRAELDAWAEQGVDAHFKDDGPWFSYHECVREPLARLVGALPHEVVAMNSLTANLHLAMVSLYRPHPRRFKILMEPTAFPSDTYAAQTQLAWHGHDPEAGVLVPAEGQSLDELLDERGDEIALLLLGGVNYYSGELYDLAAITRHARERGVVVLLDLAHAAGNVPLALHEWGVDAAVWCSYKYLNAGPGAIAGCFFHERHATDRELPRFGGWWGNDPATRFRMHLEKRFVPQPSADAWQLSNPAVLSAAPLRASLELFERAGVAALREKSMELTAYLERWVDEAGGGRFEIRTPRDPARRGAQLSLFAADAAEQTFERLQRAGLVADFRRPGVIRVAPVPLYNGFHDVWRFGQALGALAGETT